MEIAYSGYTGETETPAVNPVVQSNREGERVSNRTGDENDDVILNFSERMACDDVTLNTREGLLKLGTWNVRTMYQAEKLDNSTQEMKSNNIKLLGVAEIRWFDSGRMDKDDYAMYFSGGQQRKNGVGIIVTKKIVKAVQGNNDKNWWKTF